jgi:K+-sensing histidine kinase KdpD
MGKLSSQPPSETGPERPLKPARITNEERLRALTHDLTERVKELNCLYEISRLVENSSFSIDMALQGVVDLIPQAWQYPDVTCARIELNEKQYITRNFHETPWEQSQVIMVNGNPSGVLEVFYLEQKPECDEGPFLKEERNLLLVIAERLGHIIAHRLAEDKAKFLYQQEHELRQKLQAEMRLRVDFTRKLIHELKTPLTSLIATSQLLVDETKGGRLEKLAGYLLEGANNLNNRVEELHDVTKGEIGTLKLTLRKTNIGQLLRSIQEETLAFSEQCGITITLKIEGTIPEVTSDPERLRQVILNLINNACKYAAEGKKVILKASRDAGAVIIEVKDFGPGIPEDRQATIFDPGFQLAYHNERSGGLGIGLALCKTLVELHGGNIWLKSQVGRGTSFFFTIPVK